MIISNRREISKYILLKLIYRLSDYVKPYCYLFFLNKVVIEKKLNLLMIVFVMYIGAYLFQALVAVAMQRAYNKTFPVMVLEIKEKILQKYSEMELQQINKYNFSDLVTRLKDDTESIAGYYINIIDMVTGILASIMVIGILFYLNIGLAMACMLVLPVSFWITKVMSVRNDTAFRQLRSIQVDHNGFLYNSIQNWKEIKLCNLQNEMLNGYSLFCKKIGKLYTKTHMCWFLNRTFIAFKDMFVTKIGLYLLGGILIIRGHSEVAELLVFIQYYEKLVNQVLQLSDLKMKIAKEKISISKIMEILEVKVQQRKESRIDEVQRIEVLNVSFAYKDDEPEVLKSISLDIRKGRKIGLVGKSGCGKSTFLKLLSGMEKPSVGQILIDSHDVQEIEQKVLYSKVGMIMQEPYLFNLSIKENLLFAKQNATEEEIWEACEKAKIKDFIWELEDRLETLIGEGGIRLSGGQRQRLIIARIILYNPDIIFLDEATSALDRENEFSVVNELLKVAKNKTFVIVAHNVNSIKMCDEIYFIEDGEIVDHGKHDTLLDNDRYRRFWACNE